MTYADELKAAFYLANDSGFERTAKVLRKWLDRELAEQTITVRSCGGRIPGLAEHMDDEVRLRSN